MSKVMMNMRKTISKVKYQNKINIMKRMTSRIII